MNSAEVDEKCFNFVNIPTFRDNGAKNLILGLILFLNILVTYHFEYMYYCITKKIVLVILTRNKRRNLIPKLYVLGC